MKMTGCPGTFSSSALVLGPLPALRKEASKWAAEVEDLRSFGVGEDPCSEFASDVNNLSVAYKQPS